MLFVPLAVSIGDGFKFGCGFFLALVLVMLIGFVLDRGAVRADQPVRPEPADFALASAHVGRFFGLHPVQNALHGCAEYRPPC